MKLFQEELRLRKIAFTVCFPECFRKVIKFYICRESANSRFRLDLLQVARSDYGGRARDPRA